MPRWSVEKKIQAGIHSPDGQKEEKKKIEAGIRGPVGHGKKTKHRYPRSRWTEKYGGFLVKSRYPWPRWAKEKKKKRIKAGIHSPDGQV